jgi:hypothetical protein
VLLALLLSAQAATLEVRSAGDPLLVFVDGKEKGRTPLTLELPEGTWQLTGKPEPWIAAEVAVKLDITDQIQGRVELDWDNDRHTLDWEWAEVKVVNTPVTLPELAEGQSAKASVEAEEASVEDAGPEPVDEPEPVYEPEPEPIYVPEPEEPTYELEELDELDELDLPDFEEPDPLAELDEEYATLDLPAELPPAAVERQCGGTGLLVTGAASLAASGGAMFAAYRYAGIARTTGSAAVYSDARTIAKVSEGAGWGLGATGVVLMGVGISKKVN